MKKFNKRYLIIIIPFILLFLIISIGILTKEDEKVSDPLDSILSYDDFNKNVDIIVDKTDRIEIEKIEVDDNLNDFTLGDVSLTVDTGNNLVLSNSYIDINQKYSVLEVLVGLDGNQGYLNDAQLSTSYDYAKQYSKRWYLVDKSNKVNYLILENQISDLILNTKIEGDNITCNLMSTSGGSQIADLLTIPVDDIIDNALSNEKLNYNLYSIYRNNAIPDLQTKDIVKTIESSDFDLNGDGKNEEIIVDFFFGNSTVNTGVKVSIGEISKDFIILDVYKSVRIIDLDKSDKMKELLFIGKNPFDGYVEFLIVSYDGEKLIRTFKSNCKIDIFNLNDTDKNFEVYEIPLTDGKLIAKYDTVDSIQRWKLNVELILNEDHKLILNKNEKGYYDSDIERDITCILDLILYKEMDFNSEKIEIPKGTTMTIIGTTLDYWGVIRYEDTLYYLPIGEDGKVKDLYANCEQLFDGLAIYD